MLKSDHVSIITRITTSGTTIWNHMNQPTMPTYVNNMSTFHTSISFPSPLQIRSCTPSDSPANPTFSSSVGSLPSQCRPTVTGNNISDQPYPSPHLLYSSTSSDYISVSTRVTTIELLLFHSQYFVCAPYNHIYVCTKNIALFTSSN
jgi:hypothetical protein